MMLRHLSSPIMQLMGAGVLKTCCSTTSHLALLSTAATGSASGLELGPGAPVLVRLAERTWGPPLELSAAHIAGASQRNASPGTIAVLRDAFASCDQQYRPLPQVVRSLGSNAVAVATQVCRAESCVLVDEYVKTESGSYKLKSVATDLLRYLHQQGARVALLPDISSINLSAPPTAVKAALTGVRQSSNEVLMVSPTAFGFNEQAAQDNSFMHAAEKPGEGFALTREVLREFAGLYRQLTEVAGVKVTLYEHSLAHGTPDACFPNNWFSTHPKGESAGGVKDSTLVLYPMRHPNRSAERRKDMISVLKSRGYGALYDMSSEEANKRYFEGTGVLVLDRVNGVAYVDISERADASLAKKWAQSLNYNDLVTFRSTDLRGKSVYHTNVMMAIGTGVAIVCAESVADPQERKNLLAALNKTHEVVEISLAQMDALCGNALELQNDKGLPVMAMSTQAYNAFTEAQRQAILRHVADIVHAPIDTLERVGGGGVRCSLAELF